MNEPISDLVEVIREREFLCGVLAEADPPRAQPVGGMSEALEKYPDLRHLHQTLFGDEKQIILLYEYLKGKALPQMVSQGAVRSFIATTPKGLIIAVYTVKTNDAVRDYREAAEGLLQLIKVIDP